MRTDATRARRAIGSRSANSMMSVIGTETPNPGCCYGNPAAAYSARWMDTCKTFGTEKECTLLLHDDGTPRCVFEPLGEYEDCETLWPTTTSTPSGCCIG